MKLAVIDLGTNTFHLLIADAVGNTLTELYTETSAVLLGKGGINEGTIRSDAFERGLDAGRCFRRKMDEYGVERLRVVGTSALRHADNGKTFCLQLKEILGREPEVISGDEEARLIWIGVRQAVSIAGNALVMDIGGGSVEFIICNGDQIHWKKSVEMGASRMVQSFPISDPVTAEEVLALEQYFDEQTTEVIEQAAQYSVGELIGSAGSFDTFRQLLLRRFHPEELKEQPNGRRFLIQEFETIHAHLIHSLRAERMVNPDIIPLRVNMIVPAAVLTNYICRRLGITSIACSAYALKEGMLEELRTGSGEGRFVV